MNILVLTPFFSCEGYENIWDIRYDPQGGMQLMISRLCKAIVKADSNYKIDVVTMGQPNIPRHRKYFKNIDIYSYRVPIPKIKSSLGGYCGLIKSWAVSSMVHLLVFPKKYDVIFAHADGSGTALLLYYVISRIKGIPLILQIHSSRGATQTATTIWEMITNKLACKIELKAVQLAKYIYTLSDQTTAYFNSNIKMKKNIRKFVYLPNLNMFLHPVASNSTEFNSIISRNKTNILYVGRVSAEKGCNIIVDIAKKIDTNRFHFVFCGDGPELDNIKKLVIKNQLTNAFTFLGFIAHEKIPHIISLCNIGIVPSEYEELGLVILEMMAGKLPVIANDLSTVKQIISNGMNGLLVSKGNVDSWIRAIQLISEDDTLKQTIINNAFQKAKGISSIDSVAQIMVGDIERVGNHEKWYKASKRNKQS